MGHALFAFDDATAARRVHERLIAEGLPETMLALQGPGGPTSGKLADEIDELATGGMVRSLQHLLEGLFDGESVDQDASPYAHTLQSGGAVLRVRDASPGQQAAVDAAVLAIGCSHRTDWSPTAGSPLPASAP